MTPVKTRSKVTPHGKFFSRLGYKFFFKGMRFDQSGDTLDFPQKLAIRHRFEELSRAHTTGLILGEKHATSLLGIAAQAGFQVLVEFVVTADEVSSDRGLSEIVSRMINSVELWRGSPALAGYLIDCRIDPATLRHRGLWPVRKRLGKLIQAIRRSDPDCLVTLKHRPATAGLASLDEDLIYAEMPALAPAALRAYVVRLHNLAEARPVVLEFGEGLPGQDELMACAFGLGAAGVVAPAMRPAASPGWLGPRVLSAGELLPSRPSTARVRRNRS